jgi:dihydroxy-acid dehydratase
LGRAVIKAAGVAPENMKFRGPAKVFDSEEAAIQALFAGQVVEGDAMVVRYEGPAGGPGMRESLNISAAIAGMGLKNVALISDGRASGGSKGLSVVHVEPEAARGGYIAVIQNGDIITVDVNERTFGVEVSDRVLCERKRELPPFLPKITTGALGRYAKLVSSASEGCVLL